MLLNIDMSIIENEVLLQANHIKQARYCFQVSLCALFLKLKDAKNKSGLTLSSIERLRKSKNQNKMCYYWYLTVRI